MDRVRQSQSNLINKVILPRLVEMAIDCTLPSDMHELGLHNFAEAIVKYNESDDGKRDILLSLLSNLLSSDEDVEDALERLVNAEPGQPVGSVIKLWHAVAHLGSLTVDEFYQDFLQG